MIQQAVECKEISHTLIGVSVASEAYHDWSGEAADAQLRVNFTLKLLLSQNFCNRPLMRFISFASNISPVAAVPAGPVPAPLCMHGLNRSVTIPSGSMRLDSLAALTSLNCIDLTNLHNLQSYIFTAIVSSIETVVKITHVASWA